MIRKMVKKMVRLLEIMAIVFIILVVMIVISLLRANTYIPAHFVASYDVNVDVDTNEFGAYFTVRSVKKQLEANEFFENYGKMDGLYELLNEYDDNTRIVVSFGSRIKYFWVPKDKNDWDGFIGVKYQSKHSVNKIYIHTVNYYGSMIDFVNY